MTKALYCDIMEKEIENKPNFGCISTLRVQKNHCKKVYFFTVIFIFRYSMWLGIPAACDRMLTRTYRTFQRLRKLL